jgi:hypothetical protein
MEPDPAPATMTPQRAGFLLAWAVLVGSIVVAIVIGVLVNAAAPPNSYGTRGLIGGVLPPLALLGLLGWAWFDNRREMARGILAAFGAMFALALLGVGACFGLFALSGP